MYTHTRTHKNTRKLLFGTLALIWVLAAGIVQGNFATAHAVTRPDPFLYRPYYGTATVLSRSNSLFDHDMPWYVNDGKFVRYDGQTYAVGGVLGCQPKVSCYDGHNGYDFDMLYEPVLAAGAGKVIRAGWYNPLNHNDGFGLWVAIDHGNGYYTSYGHLSGLNVQIGQQVAAQWQIGTSGSSGSATGPHLHFSVFTANQWLPTDPFGWQGNFTDPNIVPDYYLWVGNPGSSSQAPCLGCVGGAAYTGALVVDDASSAFSASGPWKTATGSGLINGSMHYVATTTGAFTATASWRPTIPAAGAYEVGVYIDPMHASSQWVPYTVTSLGSDGQLHAQTVWVDQMHVGVFTGPFGVVNTGPRWVSLGTYRFSAGTGGFVSVSNATGEQGMEVGADAVEYVAVANWQSGSAPTAPAPTTTAAPTKPSPTPAPPTPTPPSLVPPHRTHP